MNTNNRDTDLDVLHKINTLELESWINFINFIKTDLENLIKICELQKTNNFINAIQTNILQNEYILNTLYKHSSNRLNLIECEDIHCDISFINEHKDLKELYLKHITEYQNLKNDILKKTI